MSEMKKKLPFSFSTNLVQIKLKASGIRISYIEIKEQLSSLSFQTISMNFFLYAIIVSFRWFGEVSLEN